MSELGENGAQQLGHKIYCIQKIIQKTQRLEKENPLVLPPLSLPWATGREP
jgi:hypothetical protein